MLGESQIFVHAKYEPIWWFRRQVRLDNSFWHILAPLGGGAHQNRIQRKKLCRIHRSECDLGRFGGALVKNLLTTHYGA